MKILSAQLNVLFLEGEKKEMVRLAHLANMNLFESSSLFEQNMHRKGKTLLLLESRHLKMIDMKYIVKQLKKHCLEVVQMYECQVESSFRETVIADINQKVVWEGDFQVV